MLLTVAYEGTDFHGFVRQAGLRTVEETLLEGVRSLDPSITRVMGMSRTDAGVHAMSQIAGFDATREIEPRGWVLGTNRFLPDDVAVRRAMIIPPGHNPRFMGAKKRYLYRLSCERVRDPFQRNRAWKIEGRLNFDLIRSEAAQLVGTHDFRAFRSAKDEREETIRTLFDVTVKQPEETICDITVTGGSFMHNMVRIIVGTLVDVGLRRREPGAVQRALASGNRSDAGMTAPAHGLTLEWVELRLPEGTFEAWPP